MQALTGLYTAVIHRYMLKIKTKQKSTHSKAIICKAGSSYIHPLTAYFIFKLNIWSLSTHTQKKTAMSVQRKCQ